LASKYIDEEITANRAKMLEELRHGSMVKADQYQNSPDRQALLRQNATDATMAQGAATDAASLARLNNTELQGAQKTSEDSKAADETARKVSEIGGTMGIEAKRAELIAETEARIAAKYRQNAGGGDGRSGIAEKIKQLEAVLGRDLTENEKMTALGLAGKPKDGKDPLDEVGAKLVESGSIKPGELGATIAEMRRSLQAAEQTGRMAAGVSAARQEGKVKEAIQELRGRGYSTEQLSLLGFTPEEMKSAEVKPAALPSRPRPFTERAAQQAPDPMDGMTFEQRRQAVLQRSADPVIAQLEAQRAALLKAGRATEANAVIARIKAREAEIGRN
jgi:hypothetical protein